MTLPNRIEGGSSGRGWSRLGTILFCLQQHAQKSIRSYRPSEAQAQGTVIHAGVAHTEARRACDKWGIVTAAGHTYDRADQLLSPNDAMAAEHEDLLKLGVKTNLDKAIACISAYYRHYNENWRVLHVEDVYSAEVVDEELGVTYTYTGRADLVVESNGRVLILDHKGHGGGSSERALALQYGMSGQLIGWAWLGSQVYGPRFGGVILNLIGREPDGAGQFKFSRPPMAPAPKRVATFPQTIIDAERRLASMGDRALEDYTPQLSGSSGCVGRFGACDYIETCRWGNQVTGG